MTYSPQWLLCGMGLCQDAVRLFYLQDTHITMDNDSVLERWRIYTPCSEVIWTVKAFDVASDESAILLSLSGFISWQHLATGSMLVYYGVCLLTMYLTENKDFTFLKVFFSFMHCIRIARFFYTANIHGSLSLNHIHCQREETASCCIFSEL